MRSFTLKRKWERLFFTIVFCFAVSAAALAQNGVITGKVTDAITGEPLIGATVLIQGTSSGAATDLNGVFKLNAPANATLVIKSVGYEDMAVAAQSGTLMAVKLTSTSASLSEVVVVGYGTEKKATLTGSISTVNAKAFEDKGTVTSPLQAIEGTVPGVIITRSSTVPGQEGWNVQIRGATSANYAPAPLYVIDGVAVSDNNALNALNPNDIESMSFLKDASAAIYGARAAGGVVLITTKKAKNGKAVVQYDGSFSKKYLALFPKRASLEQWANGVIQARENDGFAQTDQWILLGELMLKYEGQVISTKTFPGDGQFPAGNPIPAFGDVADYPLLNTNYDNLLWKNGNSDQQNFSISGRGEKSGYRISLGYTDDGGLIRYGDNSNTRYNLRVSNDYQLGDHVKLESSIAMDNQIVIAPSQFSGLTGPGFQPGFPAFTSNGLPYAWGGQYTPEGYAAFGGDNKTYTTRWYVNEKLTWNIDRHLDLVAVLGYDPTTIDNNTQIKSIQWYNYAGDTPGNINPTAAQASYAESDTQDNYYNANVYMNYKNSFGKHNVGLTIGSQYERDEYNFFSATTTNQESSNIGELGLGIGDNTTHSNAGTKNHYALMSFFGRANYSYDNKYLLEATLRYDGSSKFTAADRWKGFVGVSGGWLITQEDFMKHQKIFDNLKLRASYGQVGNQNGIGLYDYIQLLNLGFSSGITSNLPILGTGPAVTVGPTSQLISLDRTWEKVETTNLALDFGFLKNRLTGTAEIFEKNNVNMFINVVYPQVLGATAPLSNSGYLRTKGWEANLQWADKIGQFGYHVGADITYNQNNVINLGGASVPVAGINGPLQGQPLNSVYGYEYAGRIQNAAQLAAYTSQYPNSAGNLTPAGLRVGDNMFKDVNGDGKITTADMVNLGTEDPRYSYAFNFGFSYKGFDFNAVFQGALKRTVFRNDNQRVPFGAVYQSQDNFWVGNTWTPANTNAYYPLLSSTSAVNNWNYQASTFSVQNGAYMRMKNLVIGYTLPAAFVQRSKFISKVRVYLSGNDLFEITKIKDGFDPEAPSSVQSGNNLGEYPFYRLVTAGVNVTF